MEMSGWEPGALINSTTNRSLPNFTFALNISDSPVNVDGGGWIEAGLHDEDISGAVYRSLHSCHTGRAAVSGEALWHYAESFIVLDTKSFYKALFIVCPVAQKVSGLYATEDTRRSNFSFSGKEIFRFSIP